MLLDTFIAFIQGFLMFLELAAEFSQESWGATKATQSMGRGVNWTTAQLSLRKNRGKQIQGQLPSLAELTHISAVWLFDACRKCLSKFLTELLFGPPGQLHFYTATWCPGKKGPQDCI